MTTVVALSFDNGQTVELYENASPNTTEWHALEFDTSAPDGDNLVCHIKPDAVIEPVLMAHLNTLVDDPSRAVQCGALMLSATQVAEDDGATSVLKVALPSIKAATNADAAANHTADNIGRLGDALRGRRQLNPRRTGMPAVWGIEDPDGFAAASLTGSGLQLEFAEGVRDEASHQVQMAIGKTMTGDIPQEVESPTTRATRSTNKKGTSAKVAPKPAQPRRVSGAEVSLVYLQWQQRQVVDAQTLLHGVAHGQQASIGANRDEAVLLASVLGTLYGDTKVEASFARRLKNGGPDAVRTADVLWSRLDSKLRDLDGFVAVLGKRRAA